MRERLSAARRAGHAIAAINVVDVATMDGVLRAAVECGSPVIVQTAARTARTWGPTVLAAAFRVLVRETGARALLQLDHCDSAELAGACLDAGWDAVLFDGSALPPDRNIEATRAIVERAHGLGAAVEGELEAIRGREDGAASAGRPRASVEAALAFIEVTGIDCYAPSIGNVHGRSTQPVALDVAHVAALAAATGVPLALHGGTGIDAAELRAVIAAGCSKVNVSTALREACTSAARRHLRDHIASDDPLPLLEAIRDAARTIGVRTIGELGGGWA